MLNLSLKIYPISVRLYKRKCGKRVYCYFEIKSGKVIYLGPEDKIKPDRVIEAITVIQKHLVYYQDLRASYLGPKDKIKPDQIIEDIRLIRKHLARYRELEENLKLLLFSTLKS